MNLNFGVPSQRKVREEKHPEKPVLTLDAIEGDGVGKARRIILNTYATRMMGINEKASGNVAFVFDDSDINDVKVFIGNGDQQGVPDEHKIRVSKIMPKRISDKRTYEYITKVFNLDNSVESELQLGEKIETNGITIYPVIKMIPEGEIKREFESSKEESAPEEFFGDDFDIDVPNDGSGDNEQPHAELDPVNEESFGWGQE